jgi:hypothetical protein
MPEGEKFTNLVTWDVTCALLIRTMTGSLLSIVLAFVLALRVQGHENESFFKLKLAVASLGIFGSTLASVIALIYYGCKCRKKVKANKTAKVFAEKFRIFLVGAVDTLMTCGTVVMSMIPTR